MISYRTLPGRRGIKKMYVLGATSLLTPEQVRDLARRWLVAIRQGADPPALAADCGACAWHPSRNFAQQRHSAAWR